MPRYFKNLIRRLKQNDPHLRTLSFENQELLAQHIDQIAEALKNNTHLRVLNLANTKILDQDVIILLNALEKNVTLRSLDLSLNPIRGEGQLKAIEFLKKNLTIEKFYMDIPENYRAKIDPLLAENKSTIPACENFRNFLLYVLPHPSAFSSLPSETIANFFHYSLPKEQKPITTTWRILQNISPVNAPQVFFREYTAQDPINAIDEIVLSTIEPFL